MSLIHKLAEMGYPPRFSYVETRTPIGVSKRFEMIASHDRVLRIANRVAPDTFHKVKLLGRRSQMRLVMRFGISPSTDEILLLCAGPLCADDSELIKRLRYAVVQDIQEILYTSSLRRGNERAQACH